MATPKKTTAKKATSSKKTPAKKAPTRKAVAAKKVQEVRSFHVAPNDPTFGTFKITKETVHWVIIVSVIIFMQLWILSLQLQTSNYIEEQISSLQTNN